MECPVGLRGNLKVSLKEGSLSCRHTLVFFLMILFWVATFTTYNLTYRSVGILNKRWIWITEPAGYLKVNKTTHHRANSPPCTITPDLVDGLGSWICKWCFCIEGSPRPVGLLLSSLPSWEQPWSPPSLEFCHLKITETERFDQLISFQTTRWRFLVCTCTQIPSLVQKSAPSIYSLGII